MSTPEPPVWVYDLVIDLIEQEYNWCACIALKKVPPDVVAEAAAIRTYKHNQEAAG